MKHPAGESNDGSLLSFLRRQRGSPSTPRSGLQSRQLASHAGDAGTDQGMVDDDAARKADQARREGRPSCALRRLPDGGSRHTPKSPRRYPADDCGTSSAADYINGEMRLGVVHLIGNDGKGASR